MWRDYPQRLCDAGGYRGLVYSRHRLRAVDAADARLAMARHASCTSRRSTMLPRPLRTPRHRHRTDHRPWLFGHSDGASIALIYAATLPGRGGRRHRGRAAHHRRAAVAAQHRAARDAYVTGGLRATSCAAITTTSIRRSTAGTTPGSRRRSPAWSIESLLGVAAMPHTGGAGRGRRVRHARAGRRHQRATRRRPRSVVIPACGHSPQERRAAGADGTPRSTSSRAIRPALISQGGVQ